MNLPNLITLSRILLVPLTVWLLISGLYGFAFIAFVAAGISDGVDGYIARRYNMRTELGAYLDPAADKALLVSVYVTLALLKAIPAWLAILVVSRDVLIIGAFVLSLLMNRPVQVKPLMISKINTAGQILFVVAVLGATSLRLRYEDALWVSMFIVAALTAVSGAAYLREWVRFMASSQGSDVSK